MALGKKAYELKIVTHLPADKGGLRPGWHLDRHAFNSSVTDIWQPAVWVTAASSLGGPVESLLPSSRPWWLSPLPPKPP